MKVEFTLSSEEYADWQKDRFRKPDRSLVYGLVIIAMLVGMLGLVFYVFAEHWGKPVGLALLVAGILILIPAPFLWRSAREKTRKADEAVLRREYEQFWSDARVFEADEAGWKSVSQFGEDHRKWDDLVLVQEHGQTIELCSLVNRCLVSKPALSQGELDTLRGYIRDALHPPDKQSLFSLKFQITRGDYILSQYVHRWKKLKAQTVPWYFIGALLFIFFCKEAIVYRELGSYLYGALAGFMMLVLLFAEGVSYLYSFEKGQWKKRGKAPDMREEYFDDRVRWSTSEFDCLLKYRYFQGHSESRKLFLLYLDDGGFLIVPKRVLPQERISEFRDLLERSVPSA